MQTGKETDEEALTTWPFFNKNATVKDTDLSVYLISVNPVLEI
tara:strand:- start:41 stop:169 length:129 start_codon:yes stop_codon:yes gene_type:complete